jgi:hypothetical protein
VGERRERNGEGEGKASDLHVHGTILLGQEFNEQAVEMVHAALTGRGVAAAVVEP